MYAILRQGNHQYRVSPGDVIQIEKIGKVDPAPGDELEFENVLLLANGDDVEIGTPIVQDAKIKAKVLRNGRGKKVIVYKFKRRKGYAKKQGHRQSFTEVRITGIEKAGQALAAQ